MRRMKALRARAWFICLICLACLAWPAAAQTTPDPAETQRLHTLFARHWEDLACEYPERSTFRGDHRYGDRLMDASAAAVERRDAWTARTLAEAKALRPEALSPLDRSSLDLFIYNLEQELRLNAFDGYRQMSLGSLFGFQARLAGLLRMSPARNPADAEAILARMAAYPKRLDQEIDSLRRGLAAGYVTPRPVLERSLAQLDAQLVPAARSGPFYEPFTRLPAALPAVEREALQARAAAAIDEQVLPAMKRLRAFIVNDYLPAAPAAGGLSRYPRGDVLYAEIVAQQSTTALTPRQIHDLGLREMTRLRAEIQAVMQEVRFEGTFAQFVKHLNSDPKFFYTSPEALLAAYQQLGKQFDAEMPRLFAELPRAPYGIRALPAHLGPGAADNYNSPPADGSAPGWFNANVLAFQRRPRWALATLVAHEAVPGHHLQWARANELGALPEFRRNFGYTAYSEGWALYAETLGREIGLYSDPYSRFGHLQAQALRAARLVVDTGLHAFGWPRQQAIDYMVAEVGEDPVFVESEVDRYLSQPGQALAYMVGQLKIVELRQRATTALGTRFDLRRFHNLLLDAGSLPLAVLERNVDAWIAAQPSK